MLLGLPKRNITQAELQSASEAACLCSSAAVTMLHNLRVVATKQTDSEAVGGLRSAMIRARQTATNVAGLFERASPWFTLTRRSPGLCRGWKGILYENAHKAAFAFARGVEFRVILSLGISPGGRKYVEFYSSDESWFVAQIRNHFDSEIACQPIRVPPLAPEIEWELVQAAALLEEAGADKRTDKKKKTPVQTPRNRAVIRLAKAIRRRRHEGLPMRQIAIDFFDGAVTTAETALRTIRRFPNLLDD
jgi:hypothetical protein